MAPMHVSATCGLAVSHTSGRSKKAVGHAQLGCISSSDPGHHAKQPSPEHLQSRAGSPISRATQKERAALSACSLLCMQSLGSRTEAGQAATPLQASHRLPSRCCSMSRLCSCLFSTAVLLPAPSCRPVQHAGKERAGLAEAHHNVQLGLLHQIVHPILCPLVSLPLTCTQQSSAFAPCSCLTAAAAPAGRHGRSM